MTVASCSWVTFPSEASAILFLITINNQRGVVYWLATPFTSFCAIAKSLAYIQHFKCHNLALYIRSTISRFFFISKYNRHYTSELHKGLESSGCGLIADLFHFPAMANIKELVDAKISDNKVMVFSKSYCPFCKMAKQALNETKVKYEILEIEDRSMSWLK